MPTPQIRISKTKELSKMLVALKSQFSLLSEAEIVKLALSYFFRAQEEERIRKWEASLPLMDLMDEEQGELSQAIKKYEEAKKCGDLKEMTAEEVMKKIDQK